MNIWTFMSPQAQPWLDKEFMIGIHQILIYTTKSFQYPIYILTFGWPGYCCIGQLTKSRRENLLAIVDRSTD